MDNASRFKIQRVPGVPVGGRVRVVAPAGVVAPGKIDQGVALLQDAGLTVDIDPQVSSVDPDAPYLAGTDEARARALHDAFSDPDVDAVVCARGGYGAMRLLPMLDADLIGANPKPLIGFSDITALHGFLAARAGLASIHGPLLSTVYQHTSNGPDAHRSVDRMLDALHGRGGSVSLGGLDVIHAGHARGPLVGGNLSLLASLVGTPWFPPLDGAILFFEEVGEQAYRIDRMLTALSLGGWLEKLSGIALGDPGFVGDWAVSAQDLDAAVRRRLETLTAGLGIPVVAGLPVGHRRSNAALPFGTMAEIQCDDRGGVLVAETAVIPEVSMDREGLRELLEAGLEEDVFSGAQAVIYWNGQLVGPVSVGHTCFVHAAPSEAPPEMVRDETRFDLASLTKAIVTAPLAWYAIDKGIVDPDESVGRWLPDWHAGVDNGVTVRHLLTHTSGLPAWKPLYKEARKGRDTQIAQGAPATMRRLVLESATQGPPGVEACYSDLGFLLLGFLLERALGGTLDALAQSLIFDPLGMRGCRFVRHLDGERINGGVAATEATEVASHGASLAGVVHDENAWCMGGVAGHAGLFGTAEDVMVFATALLAADGGPPPGWSISAPTVRWAMSGRAAAMGAWGDRLGSHLGGLDTPSGEGSTAGMLLGREPVGTTVGHLGFTGTSMWVDRSRGLAAVLLTNRVHPSRERTGIREFRVRFHTALGQMIEPTRFWRALPENPVLGGAGVPRPLLIDGGRREMDVAIRAALRAGAIARSYYGGRQALEIVHKGDVDLVTQADLECESAIVSTLQGAFPGCGFLAEETGRQGGGERRVWIIDPIDGTTNFSHGMPHFAICIALEVDGQIQLGVMYDPIRSELFTARRGHGAHLNGRAMSVSRCRSLSQALVVTGFPYDRKTSDNNNTDHFGHMIRHVQGIRRVGSAGLDMAYVAAGRFDLYWELRVKPWDVSAGLIMVEEAGGRITDVKGEPFDPAVGDMLASCGPIHAEAVARLTREGAERTRVALERPTQEGS